MTAEWRLDQVVSEHPPDAATTFARVRLRTSNPTADRFYRHLGFDRTDEPDATHLLRLREPWHDGEA